MSPGSHCPEPAWDAEARAALLAIEQAAVRAWPAGETQHVDGWLWRYSGGGSQRANSVSALTYTGRDVERSIDVVEGLYGARAAPARFQVAFPLSEPDDLDARLAARAYVIRDPVTTLIKPVVQVQAPVDVVFSHEPSAAWMEVYLSNISHDRRPFAAAILARLPAERVFVEVCQEGRTLATALGVHHMQAVIAECVGTAAAARRQGAASRVMIGLEAWAAHRGARTIGLQAVSDNLPAQRLYTALGYTPVATYHYRVREEGTAV